MDNVTTWKHARSGSCQQTEGSGSSLNSTMPASQLCNPVQLRKAVT